MTRMISRWWCAALAVTLVGCESQYKVQQPDLWKQTQAEVALQRADEQVSAGRFAEARASLASYATPANHNIRLARARIDLEEGRYAAAADRLERVPDAERTAAHHEALGVAHQGQGAWPAAVESFGRAYSADPTAERLVAWVDSLVLAGDANRARDVLERERSRFPGSATIARAAARLATCESRPADAVRELRAALLHDPNDAHLRERLAEALVAVGKHGDAADAWKTLMEMAKTSEKRDRYRMKYARCLLLDGDHTNALEHFRVATHLAPDDLNAWIGLATAALAGGHVPEGVAAARRALEIDPRSDAATLALACGHARRAEYRQAADILQRANLTEVDDARVREILARWNVSGDEKID